MKKIKMNNLTYFIICLIVLILPMSFVAIGSYLIPSLNNLAFKTYYVYYGGISLSITSLFFLLITYKYIKDNFKSNNNSINNNYLLKANLIFVIFHLILSIISNVLTYFNVQSYFIFALYLFYPLIYFCYILFLDKEKLNQKNVTTILLSIYLLWYMLIPLLSFIINNINFQGVESIKSLFYVLVYNYLRFALLVMPFMSLALNKLSHEKKDKSVVNKFNFSLRKLTLIAIVLVIIAISVAIILSRL